MGDWYGSRADKLHAWMQTDQYPELLVLICWSAFFAVVGVSYGIYLGWTWKERMGRWADGAIAADAASDRSGVVAGRDVAGTEDDATGGVRRRSPGVRPVHELLSRGR